MESVELLERARDLIRDPERWNQGAIACNKHGAMVSPDDVDAVKWCATGALCREYFIRWSNKRQKYIRVSGDVLREDEDNYLDAYRMLGYCADKRSGGCMSLDDYNDHKDRTHKDIMNLYNYAIRRFRAL